MSRVRLNLGPSHALGGGLSPGSRRGTATTGHIRYAARWCAARFVNATVENYYTELLFLVQQRCAQRTNAQRTCERPFCLGVGLAVVLVAHVHTHHTTPLCYTGSGIIRPRLYKLNRKSTRSPVRSSFFGEHVIS